MDQQRDWRREGSRIVLMKHESICEQQQQQQQQQQHGGRSTSNDGGDQRRRRPLLYILLTTLTVSGLGRIVMERYSLGSVILTLASVQNLTLTVFENITQDDTSYTPPESGLASSDDPLKLTDIKAAPSQSFQEEQHWCRRSQLAPGATHHGRTIGYQCQGWSYRNFTNTLHDYARLLALGRRSQPLSPNTNILVLGNSHTRQVVRGLECQYYQRVTDLPSDYETVFENGSRLWFFHNDPRLHSLQWDRLLQNVTNLSLMEYDAIVMGAHNNYKGKTDTKRKYLQYMLDAAAEYGAKETGINYTTVPGPTVDDVLGKGYNGPIVVVPPWFRTAPKFGSELRLPAKGEAHKHTTAGASCLDSRRHIRAIGDMECEARFQRELNDDSSYSSCMQSAGGHRCTGNEGGHVDLVVWDLIEELFLRTKRQ